ncbi:MAG: hypothetical protein WBB44_00550 [Candidatus Nanopelagicales bacterium]
MITGSSGNARERKVMFGGNASNDRLRAVSPGCGQGVRSPLDGIANKVFQVVTLLELYGFDPARACLVG